MCTHNGLLLLGLSSVLCDFVTDSIEAGCETAISKRADLLACGIPRRLPNGLVILSSFGPSSFVFWPTRSFDRAPVLFWLMSFFSFEVFPTLTVFVVRTCC